MVAAALRHRSLTLIAFALSSAIMTGPSMRGIGSFSAGAGGTVTA